MIKKVLRKYYMDQRKTLSEKDLLRFDDLLLIQFQHWPIMDIQTLLSYWPIKEKAEVNTHLMADYLGFRIPDLRLAFPIMDIDSHRLKPVAVTNHTEYELNDMGIAEPVNGVEISTEEIDAVFVPLLCFDLQGYRVGYGKGFYDRFLAECREDVIKIGFSYFEPVNSIDDINEFDVPLNLCITPNKLYEF